MSVKSQQKNSTEQVQHIAHTQAKSTDSKKGVESIPEKNRKSDKAHFNLKAKPYNDGH